MQGNKLAVALEHGCDDTVLWTTEDDEEKLVAETTGKGLNGGFHAIIDFVNTTTVAERNFQMLKPVRLTVFAYNLYLTF